MGDWGWDRQPENVAALLGLAVAAIRYTRFQAASDRFAIGATVRGKTTRLTASFIFGKAGLLGMGSLKTYLPCCFGFR